MTHSIPTGRCSDLPTFGGMSDCGLPDGAPTDPTSALINASVDLDGLVTATYANGEDQVLGKVAMATFPAMEGLRPIGDAHWQSTGESGDPTIDAATNGPMGTIRSGTLERSHVDIRSEEHTSELQSLMRIS